MKSRSLAAIVFSRIGSLLWVLCTLSFWSGLHFVALAQEQSPDEFSLVHYGDIVDVDVVGELDFDWRGKLNPEGYLDGLNSYGDPIYGLCRDTDQILGDVQKAYSVYLRDPKIIVRVLDRSGRAEAIIDGAIKTSQRFQLRRPATLRELLVVSGGITDNSGGEIRIFRPKTLSCGPVFENAESNDTQSRVIPIADILKGVPGADPLIRSGDLITVVPSVPIYVIGGVVNPRQIAARSKMTLSRAIASAGGLAKEGLADQVIIYRRDGLNTTSIEADLKKIADGKTEDIELQAFDIVEVGRKGSERRKYPPIISDVTKEMPGKLPLRIIE